MQVVYIQYKMNSRYFAYISEINGLYHVTLVFNSLMILAVVINLLLILVLSVKDDSETVMLALTVTSGFIVLLSMVNEGLGEGQVDGIQETATVCNVSLAK